MTIMSKYCGFFVVSFINSLLDALVKELVYCKLVTYFIGGTLAKYVLEFLNKLHCFKQKRRVFFLLKMAK